MTEFETLVLHKLDLLDAKVDKANDRLTKHMEDEEGEIERLTDKFVALQQSVDSYSTRQESLWKEMQTAFLDDPERPGHKDYLGHNSDHKTRKRWYDKWTRWLEDGFGNLVKIVMASGGVWLVYEIWKRILEGPQ